MMNIYIQSKNSIIKDNTKKCTGLWDTNIILNNNSILDTGSCGENAIYYIYSDGSLIIEGDGSIYDYSNTEAPWSYYSDLIENLYILDGISYI